MVKIETDTKDLFARYPHLRAVELLWGSHECREFLAGLMFDDRANERHGFDTVAAQTILALLDEHDARFPQFSAGNAGTQWSDDPLGRDVL
jgi:hypothetical protein